MFLIKTDQKFPLFPSQSTIWNHRKRNIEYLQSDIPVHF